MRQDEIAAANSAGGNVSGAGEPLISDDAYRRAVEHGRAAVAPYLGALPRNEGDVESAGHWRGRATASGATPLPTIAGDALLRGRQFVLPQVRSDAEAGNRDEIKPAEPAHAVTGDNVETIGRGGSDIDGGRGDARSRARLLLRPTLLLGAGLIVAVAIAAVSALTQSNHRNPRPTAPNVKAAAVLARPAPKPKQKPKLNAAPKRTTTSVAATSPPRTSPVRKTAGTSRAPTASSRASGDLAGTTSVGRSATAPYGGGGGGASTSHPQTSTANPQRATGSPYTGSSEPTGGTGSPGRSSGSAGGSTGSARGSTGSPSDSAGSSGKNSSQPAASSTGPASSSATSAGVISSGGG